ncbi:cysteine desulfurase DndA [Prescottella equi]|uniref:cysteine desulfurase DndA n=1 Tax=Rhodococcus hoagii TaxID=43767 RepID=UPI000A11328F|nr:cysteine desulfurase DndA [Prescottella equi]ORL10309.1 cysteine desulfurase DndA [Prescottella equi]
MTVAPSTDNFDETARKAAAPTYLDCNATAPIDPVVLSEVVEYLQNEFGNAGSRTHSYGQRAKERVIRAREEVASVVAAKPDEVVFTSGATESNNLAILGLEEAGRATSRRHIITTQIEHKAVLEPVERLRNKGFDITLLPPTKGGWVEPTAVADALRPDTLLVSVMAANNETGVVQPIGEIADVLATHEAYFHSDAAQAFGKLTDELRNPRIDMLSVSGHKLYAPKGIGALIARRRGYKRIPLTPLAVGGGQERGLRAGTLPVALIAGLATAANEAAADHEARMQRCHALRAHLISALEPLGVTLNGDLDRTMPHTLNFSVPGVDSEAAIVALKDLVAISNGSACTSQSYDPSHVLVAMNLSDDQIQGALRFSWSHMTPEPDWPQVVERLRQIQRS